MKDSGAPKLSPRHWKAVELLATGLSIRRVATELGVGDSTVRRWCRRPEFAAALREAQREAWGHMVRKLRALADKTVGVLQDVMEGAKDTPGARVSACRAVLDFALRAEEVERLEELEQRLAVLEERLAGR
ncbi:MAG: helix-turn-helix domain-containing protein [Thermoleophilia bacterium]|nr:helix-turn-helix domain-containing protein [Thermoleophilia bacterium]